MLPEITLIIQLTLAGTGQVIRAEAPMLSVEECWDAARQALAIRQHGGVDVQAVAAGCHVTVADSPA